MFCPHCGKEIADGSYICPICGATVEEQQAQPQAQPQQQQYQPQYQQPQYNTPTAGKQKNILATLGLVFGIIGAVLTLIAFIIVMVVVGQAIEGSVTYGSVYAVYIALALKWIALPCLLLGIGLGIGGAVMAKTKNKGHFGVAIAGIILSACFFIFWIITFFI